jgi:hypothetical protein
MIRVGSRVKNINGLRGIVTARFQYPQAVGYHVHWYTGKDTDGQILWLDYELMEVDK